MFKVMLMVKNLELSKGLEVALYLNKEFLYQINNNNLSQGIHLTNPLLIQSSVYTKTCLQIEVKKEFGTNLSTLLMMLVWMSSKLLKSEPTCLVNK